MSVYDDVLTATIELINQTSPYSSPVIGSLPPDNGISIAWSSGSLNTFMDKQATVEMTAVLNAKNTNAQTVSDTLGAAHVYLNRLTSYPSAENFQITNIETISPPSYLGREENNQWLYGSSLQIKFFLKGD